ncbi:MAG TPA: T9SS type A sorting domain-containing protein, partial [Candidatus Cloacimonetes bacterium]|nr:T9SS type A sorting domain-containing protein [Candidatus Cloacimonadota bacterium]
MNYPNPFNADRDGITTISIQTFAQNKNAIFEIDEIGVYSLKGSFIKDIDILDRTENGFTVSWDGTDVHGISVPSGIYLLKAEIGNSEKVCKKIVLIR